MRTCEQRVEELHLRMKTRRHEKRLRRYRLAAAAVSCACVAAVVLFAVGFSRVNIPDPGIMQGGAAASIFADHAALGYVVTAILAFCLGALVTLLCRVLKKQMTDEERTDG